LPSDDDYTINHVDYPEMTPMLQVGHLGSNGDQTPLGLDPGPAFGACVMDGFEMIQHWNG